MAGWRALMRLLGLWRGDMRLASLELLHPALKVWLRPQNMRLSRSRRGDMRLASLEPLHPALKV